MRVSIFAVAAFFVVALGCIFSQPQAPAGVPAATIIPTPTVIPTTASEWTGEKFMIYWSMPPFRTPPIARPEVIYPTPIPTQVPATEFGKGCLAGANCSAGYFCNWFTRCYSKAADGNATSMKRICGDYGDKLCYLPCGLDEHCGPGEYCGSITKYRGLHPMAVTVCMRK
ncbi:MAG: hypothetical protein V1708_00130 [Candidatus Micrarchaeota archaeon]